MPSYSRRFVREFAENWEIGCFFDFQVEATPGTVLAGGAICITQPEQYG